MSSHTSTNKARPVFWTSGWDSTYMVIRLLRAGYAVQPIYIYNPKRKSRDRELAALDRLSALISARIKTGQLLPYRVFNLKDINIDPEVAQAFDDIAAALPDGQRPLGYQYRYLASFIKQNRSEFPTVALGLEKALSPETCACSAIIRQFGALTPDMRIDPSSAPALVALLGDFEFPIMDTTEPEMRKQIKDWGYEDIMREIWFCHRPIKGEPCGVCNPCSSKIAGHMDFLLPATAIGRYDNLRRIGEKYGPHAKKFRAFIYKVFQR